VAAEAWHHGGHWARCVHVAESAKEEAE